MRPEGDPLIVSSLLWRGWCVWAVSGQRVQLSVFECLLEEKQAERMKAGIVRLVDEEEDTVRIYRLCAACEERVGIIGKGVRSEDPDVYIV